MRKWEYTVLKSYTQASLNTLGDEGWELVGFDQNDNAYLKRPKS